MKLIILIIPFLTSFMAMLMKGRFVRFKDGKKVAIIEILIDVVKFIIVYLVIMLANVFFGISKLNFAAISIDIIMLGVFLIVLLLKKYNYAERKAISGIASFILILVIMLVTIFKMLIKKYDTSDNTIETLFIKSVSYLFVFMWCAISSELGEKSKLTSKIKNFWLSIVDSSRKRNISKIEFYTFAVLTLFIFLGDENKSFVPIGLFGIHEILNRKYFKGFLYIIIGNIILIFKQYMIGPILIVGYILVALIDLLCQLNNFDK